MSAVATPSSKAVAGSSTALGDGDNYFTMKPKERVLLFDKQEVPPWDASLPPVVPICESLLVNNYAVIDDFIPEAEEALALKQEVAALYLDGRMRDGEIGSGANGSKGGVRAEMRTDKVVWMEGDEVYVGKMMKRHILRMDILTQKINMLLKAIAPDDKKELVTWEGAGRSKIMATCYPAGGSRYVAHYDNPNENGRKLTTILYLNEQWRAPHGGSLRIKTQGKQVDVAPLFNRLLCFWSDRRCPHEVMPTAKGHDRFAITIWYLDAAERRRAELRTLDEKPIDQQ